MDAFTPAQTTELVSRIGAKKARMRLDKMFVNSVVAGPLLGFGCALSLSTSASPWFQEHAPGLIRTFSAIVFPVGIMMVVLTGADLFTSYILFSTMALLHRRITIMDLLKTWIVSFLGNLGGMLLFTIVLVGYGGIFDATVYREEALVFANNKMILPGWHQIFLKGILANWLVTLAIWQTISAREIISKIFAVWLPVMCFVGLATDHVIANMFFMPLAIFLGDSKISVGYYIWKSMIPAGLGNIVGGGLFVAGMYWYLYLAGTDVAIHFDHPVADIAVYEQSGPVGEMTQGSSGAVPDSRSNARSGLELDLNGNQFKKETSRENSNA